MKHAIRKLKNSPVLFFAIVTLCMVILLFQDGFVMLDSFLSDAMYQSPTALDGNVIVIGMDAEDLENFGPWPWDRSVIAQAVEILNSNSDQAPAAIGIDVIFSGYTNEESDNYLLSVATADNVILPMQGEFTGTMLQDENGSYYYQEMALVGENYPFAELVEQGNVAHINSMYDEDGVLRHHLWSFQSSLGEMHSMSYKLYEAYQNYWGLEADFRPTTDELGFWWVDYSAQPGGYFYYNVTDIINGTYDPAILSGAAVLIGVYDTGFSDHFITAIDRASPMYGVEFLANVTTAMIEGIEKTNVSDTLQMVVLAVLMLCSLTALSRLSIKLSVPLLLAEIGLVYGLCYAMYQWGYILHPLWGTGGLALGGVCMIVRGIVQSRKERRFVLNTFQRYVDPSIIHELMKEDSNSLGLGGKSCNIAVLFVDIRGFTPLSEGLSPETVVQILNEYLALTAYAIKETGGTLDKFIGDCTMAFWGAPLPCEDPIYNACQAAMKMVEGMEKMGRDLQEKYGRDVSFGVGVNYGPAVVGNIGYHSRMDYTAIGDTVNTSARLEANAPRGTVYISPIVAEKLGSRGITKALDTPLALKGKAEPMQVYQLLGLQEETP